MVKAFCVLRKVSQQLARGMTILVFFLQGRCLLLVCFALEWHVAS